MLSGVKVISAYGLVFGSKKGGTYGKYPCEALCKMLVDVRNLEFCSEPVTPPENPETAILDEFAPALEIVWLPMLPVAACVNVTLLSELFAVTLIAPLCIAVTAVFISLNIFAVLMPAIFTMNLPDDSWPVVGVELVENLYVLSFEFVAFIVKSTSCKVLASE